MTDYSHPFVRFLVAHGALPPEPARHTGNGAGTAHRASPVVVTADRMSRWVSGAVVAECEHVAGTAEGSRNHELNRAAFRLGQLVGAGELEHGAARDALEEAGAACGLPATEVARTVASGLAAGIQHPRVIDLGPDDGGTPPAYTVPADGQADDHGTAADQGGNHSGTTGNQGNHDPAEYPADAGSGLPQPLDWVELWAGGTVAVDWLVPDVVERGRSHVLYAPAKAGKSLYVQWLCAELASQGTHVVYLDLENSRADILERFQAMGHEPEDLVDLRYFSFPSLAMLDTPAGGAQLAALVAEHEAELVVLDTTSRVVAGDENSADTFRALYRYALVHLKRLGMTVLRIDHTGKNPEAGQRGSSAKRDDVDTAWLMVRHDADHFTLRCDAQRSGHHPQTVDLVRQTEPLRFARAGEGDLRPAIAVLVAELDRLRLPKDVTRRAAHAALRAAGIRAGNGPLSEALNMRRISSTSWDSWSRTKRTEVDQTEINFSGPQDQDQNSVSAGEPGPGPSADHADHAPRPVGDAWSGEEWSLVGDHSGPSGPAGPEPTVASPEPAREQDQPRPLRPNPFNDQLRELPDEPLWCDRCRYPTDRLLPAPHGRQLCVACAYPDPSTRPGAHSEEHEGDS